MARQITAPPEVIDKLLAKAKQQLLGKKYSSDKIKVSLSLEKDNRKAEVYFSAKAWIKMTLLVKEFSTEVQWHGTVKRISASQFFVEDILVFPHEVTATTVISKQEEYEAWLDSLDDNSFNKLRLHGHSHVRMGVRPSNMDDDVQSKFLKGLGKPTQGYDPFYIFFIINKDSDTNTQIYDITNNAYYDETEVKTKIFIDTKTDLDEFVEDAKKVAVEPVKPVGFLHNNYSKKGKKKDANITPIESDFDEETFYNYYGNGGYFNR